MAQRKETEPKKVPTFKDEIEAGEFWDTHSPLDYPDHFQEVEVTFSRPLIKRGLTIKLSDDIIEQLKQIGKEQGVGPSTLARMAIMEYLRGRAHKQP